MRAGRLLTAGVAAALVREVPGMRPGRAVVRGPGGEWLRPVVDGTHAGAMAAAEGAPAAFGSAVLSRLNRRRNGGAPRALLPKRGTLRFLARRHGLALADARRVARAIGRAYPPADTRAGFRAIQRERGQMSGRARRGRPATWKRAARCAALLDASAAARARGLPGMTVREIAAEVGCSASTVVAAPELARRCGELTDREWREARKVRREAARAFWRRHNGRGRKAEVSARRGAARGSDRRFNEAAFGRAVESNGSADRRTISVVDASVRCAAAVSERERLRSDPNVAAARDRWRARMRALLGKGGER